MLQPGVIEKERVSAGQRRSDGGILGVVLGYTMTELITLYAQWKTIVQPWTIALSFGVAAAVGVGFGFYPARKAALLNPIDALRYECPAETDPPSVELSRLM